MAMRIFYKAIKALWKVNLYALKISDYSQTGLS